jgi:monoamine oxidase
MADAVIVTVPTPFIAAQGIRFRPELTDKAAAASVLPLGLADKLVMAVEVPELLPMDGHLIGNPNRTATGVLSAGLSSKDFSADGWRTSSRPRDPARFSISPSLSLSNCSVAAFAPACARSSKPAGARSFRTRILLLRASRPCGRTCHARHTSGGRVVFAGEACSRHDFTTAHGAYLTGIEAADEAIALSPPGIRRSTAY